MKNLIVTGSSGFIWFHLCKNLLQKWWSIIGIDNENEYYDRKLKINRRNILSKFSNFTFYAWSTENKAFLEPIFHQYSWSIVIHLAAQAWVRYSITHPDIYIQSNIVGFFNIIELCREFWYKKLIYASSSSVYWDTDTWSLSEDFKTDKPISLYASTKKSNELMAYAYEQMFWITSIWLRFFTTYWPWWRPDMAYFKFTEAIINNKPIEIYNNGDMLRDFTFIDDIVWGILKAIEYNWTERIFNLWNNQPIYLKDFVSILEYILWKEAIKEYKDNQIWDVYATHADISLAKKEFNRKPKYSLEDGLKQFITWFRDYYGVNY